MYQFATTAERDAFRAALDNGAAQLISATIIQAGGTPVNSGTYAIIDFPSIDSRCVEDEEVYNIAGMYIGELKLRIKPFYNIRAAALIGGSVSLRFGLEGVTLSTEDNMIPLGIWDIKDAKRNSGNFIDIVGNDHMARLGVPTGIDEIGMIHLQTVLDNIEAKTGILFAQNATEILALALSDEVHPSDPDFYVSGYCTHFEETCWEEVRMIAQLICGFAFANREGKIEFRRFMTGPILDINAERRFHTKLSEQSFNVRGTAYTNSKGKTYIGYNTLGPETSSIICIPNNKYIGNPGTDEGYQAIADAYARTLGFAGAHMYPGTVEFYGDPSLDLGDMVAIKGGIGYTNAAGQNSVEFLVCSNFWQFRAPQTIISGGAPEAGQYAASSSSSSGSSAIPTPSSGVANLGVSTLTNYTGTVFATERTIARTRFGCTSDTNAFLECSYVFLGTHSTNIHTAIYIDDELQPLSPKTTVDVGRYSTLSFSLNFPVENGAHNISIIATGASELIGASGCVWGQFITAEELEYSNEFSYEASDGEAAITGYLGTSQYIEIPEKEDGNVVTSIRSESFTYLDLKTVYIPEGVTSIG